MKRARARSAVSRSIKFCIPMKLYAISDLHIDYELNRAALEQIPDYPDDWLILGGDICTAYEHLECALKILTERFAQILWVPGNHDLWSRIGGIKERGEEKYHRLVSICRQFGVITPEDPFPLWQGEGGEHHIVPLFLLYDYSFRPDDVPVESAVSWAEESGVVCTDEYLLYPKPYPSRSAWCHARCRYSEHRVQTLSIDVPTVLINHFPLREDIIRLYRIPRFSIWCGTRRSERWHLRYAATVVVSGHLHMRGTLYRDGVRFEEVSLGYPRNWDPALGIEHYFRQILPAPESGK